MASNFFTKPFGLHPTPSTCFPPPPRPETGIITIDLTPLSQHVASPATITVNLLATNTLYQLGVPIGATWTVPDGIENPVIPVQNGQPIGHTFDVSGTPGIRFCTVKLVWPNGQTRTTPFTYTID